MYLRSADPDLSKMIIPPKTNSSCNLSNKLKGKIGDAKWLDLYYSGLLFTWTIILTIEAVNFDPVLKDLMSLSWSFKFLNGRKCNCYVLLSKSKWYYGCWFLYGQNAHSNNLDFAIDMATFGHRDGYILHFVMHFWLES